MWKRLAVAVAVALVASAATASAQDLPPTENPYDPSGCNEYHQMRERLDAMGSTVPTEFQTAETGEPADIVVVDPLYDMLSLMILWNSEAFPCK